MLKKVVLLLLVLVMLTAVFIGCAPKAEETKDLTFGYIAYNMKDIWNQYGEEAFQYAAALKGVTVISEDAKNDPAEQVKIAEGMIAKGVDAISIFPCTPEVGATVVRMANEAGIPIAIENIFLPDDASSGEIVGQVACQYGDIGYAAIEYIAKTWPGAKVFYNAGAVGMGVFESYIIGVEQALEDYAGEVELVGTLHGNWETERAMEVTEDFISTGVEFDVVFANNDLMATGVYNALKDADMADIPIISTGGSPFGLEMIADGIEYANMTAPVNIQGLIVFQFLWYNANGIPIEETKVPLPIIPVDVNNLDTAIGWDNNDGAWEWIGGME